MKTFKQFVAIVVFILIIGNPTFAGDVGGATGSCSTPAPAGSVVNTNNPNATGSAANPVPDALTAAELWLALLLAALSIK